MSGGINENYHANKKRAPANTANMNSPNGVGKNNRRHAVGNNRIATETFNLEEMIAYIRCNPSAARQVHQHLTHVPYVERVKDAFEASTPQTPKRNLETSDSDGTHIAKQQRIFSNGKEKRAGTTPTVPTLTDPAHSMSQRTTTQQQHRIPFEQLRRAVSSNLPCFLIEYDPVVSARERPSDVAAASAIEEAFRQQGAKTVFSLVGHAGSKLKLGVNNKDPGRSLRC
jgi:hypothetical protein